ncbi:uncharacterized protein Dwil_GK12884 [Drosophila willistoni]|uniref:Major facilitator superfamily (MFS) profile domain-containing protein n=1 Tax=Drosophila willistoni TaxID=7260 RepID=B4NJ89_DROWI|nr:facilitated trehalose transporter Tret1 [Drosophila willistoni]EDW84920.1 uncharacterized protein Dwil_GK12884 [Drosophila willistoni]
MFDKVFQRSDCLLNRRNRYVFLITLLTDLIAISHGISIGWFSPTLRKLQSPDSPVNFELTLNEISWVGSLVAMGSGITNIIFGLLLDRLGNRVCLLLLAFPNMCGWLLIYYAQSVEFLYAARLLTGFSSGGMYIVNPIFISEISNAKIRGSLSSMMMLFMNTGILIGYILSSHIPYHIMPWIAIICPATYFLSMVFFVRESPMYLIRKGKLKEAEESYCYYNNIRNNNKNISDMAEFETMRIALTKSNEKEEAVTWKDFVTPAALKAYAIATALVITNQFSCIFPLINFMSTIFAQSGSQMNPDTCTIIVGAVQLLGTYGTTLLCDICGRKLLLLVSTAGVAISLTAFGLFTHFAQIYDLSEWSWLPLVFMSSYIFLGNIGLIGCFVVCLVELFPYKIRSKATSAFIVSCSLIATFLLWVFPLCMEHWGIDVTMWSIAGITGCGFCFLFVFLKETKGKSMLDD